MRGFRFALIAVATAVAIYSLVTAATAYPDSAMGFTSEGTAVAYVLPGGPVWRDGVRAGDVVVSLQDGASAGGWELVAEGSGGLHLSNWSSHLAQLRGTVDIALVGAILVFAASVLLLRRSPWGAALIPIAVGLAAVPLLRTGNLGDLLLAGSGAFLVAGASIVAVAARTTSRAGIGLLVALAVALAAAWVLAIRVVPVAFDVLDVLRLPLLAALTLLATIVAIDRRRLLRRLSEASGPNPLDLVYLPGVFALALVGLQVLDLPPVPVLAVAAVLVLVYPAARRTTARVVERALIGDVRRQAELRAIEQERGRLAREIHDAPLQELAAVIRHARRPAGHAHGDGGPAAGGRAAARRGDGAAAPGPRGPGARRRVRGPR